MPTTNQEEIIITIIAAVIIFIFLGLLFIFLIVGYQQRKIRTAREKAELKAGFEKQILQSQVETQEETFSVISKELHDNIGQLLNTGKLLVAMTQQQLAEKSKTLDAAEDTLAKAIHEVRTLSKTLNKEWLQQFNLLYNLETEIQRLNASQTLQINLSKPDNIYLSNEVQLILFRIVQEVLQNALKHSKATELNIIIHNEEKYLHLEIKDNGISFDVLKQSSGQGLNNIKYRTQLLGGSIVWTSDSSGTKVELKIPVINPAL